MSGRTPDHQEQEADSQLTPNQHVQAQSPVKQPSSPSAAHRALRGSGKLSPRRILALQRTVGNRAVQRIVAQRAEQNLVQRHISDRQKGAANSTLSLLGAASQSAGELSKKVMADHKFVARAQKMVISSTLGGRSLSCETGFASESAETTGGYNQVEGEIPTSE